MEAQLPILAENEAKAIKSPEISIEMPFKKTAGLFMVTTERKLD